MIFLRPRRQQDFVVLARMRRDRRLQHMLLAYPGDTLPGDDAVTAWLIRREQEGAFRVICDADDQCIGFAQLHDIHRRAGHAMMAIALAADMRGKGFGRDAMAAIHTFAAELGLRKVMLEVRADNEAAIALYVATGYRNVGVMRDHYDDGTTFQDVMLMERMLA